MKRVAVVYWSGTGNTKMMAHAVLDGACMQQAEASLYAADEFDASRMAEFDTFAFGCPAMGAETLEEMEFEPMFSACEKQFSGRDIALFGSYGWGGGEWMRMWEERCEKDGANLVCESVICADAPDAEILSQCRAMGEKLAQN